jgi:hypothetical protein
MLGLVGPPFAPVLPLVRVYELGSSIERSGVWVAGLPGADIGGGGGIDVLGTVGVGDPGGGGGGAAGAERPNAFRAACSASEGV